jgi:glycosyltransferase involved in cell wall biosynthesis
MANNTSTTRASTSDGLASLSLAVVGVARNCEANLRADIKRIQRAAEDVQTIVWLIIESDSSDETLTELQALQSEIPDFHYLSLGQLASKIPKRTERIAFCRNYYLEQLRTDPKFSHVDYVAVADLDGVNSELTKGALASCWERDGWDMCAANQSGPYFDIWALRHKDWCPADCWAQYRFLNLYRSNLEENLWASVYSKMITLPQEAPWIEVDSAFGGFAIYKKSVFDNGKYIGLTAAGDETCEHVSFHAALREKGFALFINPKLINAKLTEHTRQLSLLNTISRLIKTTTRNVVARVIGLNRAKTLAQQIRRIVR